MHMLVCVFYPTLSSSSLAVSTAFLLQVDSLAGDGTPLRERRWARSGDNRCRAILSRLVVLDDSISHFSVLVVFLLRGEI